MYFKDVKRRMFKGFPSTADIVRSLPRSLVSAANAHSLILWKLLSNYVHYSAFTQQLENTPASREIEINQLQEVLSYVYKALAMSSMILNKWGLKHDFRDPTNLKDELMADYKSASDLGITAT